MCSLEVSNALLCTKKAEGGHKDCEFLLSHRVRKMQKGEGMEGERERGRETERKREVEGGRDALNT